MRSGKLPRPGKHTPVHHQQVEEITHWHGSAEAVGKVTNQAGTHCDYRDGHRNRELSPWPDRIRDPPERSSEGVCSNKMSVVGYVPYPLNDSSFLIQPTLPELQRLAEVMGSLSTDAPAGVAAMIEEAAQLAPHEAERDAVRVPNDVAVTSKPVIAAMDEYPCCVKSGRRDSAADSRRVRRRLSSEAIAQVVERYQTGATAAELGAEHGVSKNGMLKLLREQGAQIRGKSLPTAVVTQAMHLHERGASMRQVSEQLGVSRTALRRNFQKMGVGV